ncbi:hypothetical protein psal_cds_863 [Pandoravirus salinus]|uniref:Uncharacterized protein n=1 Tax=Pandoravirus salinus TaxID=1349410 RepID=S4VZI8_9VIRU|nr:hypothetical protein psal_cds_863 [Pandoravirus salinus]AGO84926.1 hypothetical protein psal_cds_863 [Pandoravirus salinus]
MLCDDSLPLVDQPVEALAVRLAATLVAHALDAKAPRARASKSADGETVAAGTSLDQRDDLGADYAPDKDNPSERQRGVCKAIVYGDDTEKQRRRAQELVDRCPENSATPPSAWQSLLDTFAATLPTRGAPLHAADPSGVPLYSTGTALAVVQRVIPVLEAHRLGVYGMRLCPEHADSVASPWCALKPIIKVDCGAGEWLLQVICGRAWSDEVREGQELAGGVFRVQCVVHRHTDATLETKREVLLGDGPRFATDALFAFFRSGCTSPRDFVDVHYGRVYRAPAALITSLGWRLSCEFSTRGFDRWSVASAGDERWTVFARPADGVRVWLVSRRGSLFVGGGPPSAPLPAAAYPDPSMHDRGDHHLVAVPRPPVDYADDPTICSNNAAQDTHEVDRRHDESKHLIVQGLLDPMHMVSGWTGDDDSDDGQGADGARWPYTRFEFDPDLPMDAAAEGDWHSRLAARMHLVADLIQGDYGPPADDDALAAINASASGLLTHARLFCNRSPDRVRRINGRTCNALVDHLTSIGAARTWRIWHTDMHLRRGSRHHDPTRGLYTNWFVECDFVQRRSDGAPATVRFYGHIVGIDGAPAVCGARSSATASSLPCGRPPSRCGPESAGHIVAAYYCLSARRQMPDRDHNSGNSTRRSRWAAQEGPGDTAVAAAIDAAIDNARPSAATRFAADQPHPLVAYYRDREFALAPGQFRGILDEDALCIDVDTSGRSAGAAMICALDWVASAFDRHAALFAVPAHL